MGSSIRFFSRSHSTSDNEKQVASYVSNETDRNLLSAIIGRDGVTNSELSREFNNEKSSTYRYLKKYMESNIVKCRVEGRCKRYYVNRDYETILKGYMDKSVV